MKQARRIPVPAGSHAPEVRLLDARAANLDDLRLRDWARATTESCGAPHVSRSYRYPFALVGWHSGRVGVDIERIGSCDTALAGVICGPAERLDLARSSDPDAFLTSLWCGKEALSKALGDALDYDPARLDAPSRWPELRAGRWRAAALTVAPQHTAWVCWEDEVSGPAKQAER